MLHPSARLLSAALGFLWLEPRAAELQQLHRWLDSSHGEGFARDRLFFGGGIETGEGPELGEGELHIPTGRDSSS
jgi:hypothetical protein